MNECVTCLCYGCVHGKDGKVMHNLWNKFTFVYLDSVIEAAIMEQYRNKVGLVAIKWCDVLDPEYRCTTWKEWFTDVTS